MLYYSLKKLHSYLMHIRYVSSLQVREYCPQGILRDKSFGMSNVNKKTSTFLVIMYISSAETSQMTTRNNFSRLPFGVDFILHPFYESRTILCCKCRVICYRFKWLLRVRRLKHRMTGAPLIIPPRSSSILLILF